MARTRSDRRARGPLDITDHRSFAQRLQRLMEERGLTQVQVAKLAGLEVKSGNSSVHDWLKQGASPNSAPLATLCTALHVSMDWLLRGRGTPEGRPAPLAEHITAGGPPGLFSADPSTQKRGQGIEGRGGGGGKRPAGGSWGEQGGGGPQTPPRRRWSRGGW